jgi:hypothetical protein
VKGVALAITSTHLDQHMSRRASLKGYTTSGSTVSVATPSVTAQELRELLDVAAVTGHEVSLVSGTLTLKPR